MFLDYICSIFDLFLWIIFYNGVLDHRKEKIPAWLFFSFFLIGEIFLFGIATIFSSNYSDSRVFINTCLSLLISFALTFLYDCNLRHKFFATISFNFLCLASEFLVYEIIVLCFHEQAEEFLSNQAYGAICAKIISFLLCTIVVVFFQRKRQKYTLQYTALLLIMPILSMIILITIPARSDLSALQSTFGLVGTFGLLFANIINYYLLGNELKVRTLEQRECQLNQQISFQLDKYQQISEAYRNSRAIVHDIKKQYVYLENCIETKKYDQIVPFLKDSLRELDATSTRYQSGNLVIDSFLSNYNSLAIRNEISFDVNLKVDLEQIVIEDYDLCIILGNLLDNSFQACHKNPSMPMKQIRVHIFTSSKELVIHISNPVIQVQNITNLKDATHDLYHGFGTTNIMRATKKYSGTYTHSIEEGWYHAIVSIPNTRTLSKNL